MAGSTFCFANASPSCGWWSPRGAAVAAPIVAQFGDHIIKTLPGDNEALPGPNKRFYISRLEELLKLSAPFKEGLQEFRPCVAIPVRADVLLDKTFRLDERHANRVDPLLQLVNFATADILVNGV